MSAKPFLDTNVLVYAYSLDDPRNDIALELLASGAVVSVQVLNEFVDVLRRKAKSGWDEIEQALSDLGLLLDPPLPLTSEDHREAVRLARLVGARIYDALILSVAKRAGCRLLYTKDLQHGRTIEGVTIRNPFIAL